MPPTGSSPLGKLLRRLSSPRRCFGSLILAFGLLGLPMHYASAVTTYRALVMRTTLLNSVPSKSKATMYDMFFTNAKGVYKLYEEASYGQATWTGTVIDVSINYSTTDGSNDGQWCDAAEAKAREQGYEPNNYDAKVTMCDSNSGGYAVGNGGTNRVFVGYTGNLAIAAHEIGHGIAFNHAATDFNNDGVVDDEYGDQSEVMGSVCYTFNAPHRVQKGWLAPTVLNANGTYTVAPLQQSSGTRVLRYNPSGGGQSYFFSYRQSTGWDSQTTWWDGNSKPPIRATFTTGLNIHRFQGPGDTDHTLQIAQPLQDGGSYTIPGTSVVIKQNSHNGNGVSITVSGIGGGTTGSGSFTGAGTYRLTPYAAAGSALNVPGFNSNVQTVIWGWGGGTNEKFNFVSLGGGLYKIQCAFNTNQVLDAYGAGDNSAVGVWADNGQSQQKWQVVDVGGGYYSLRPQNAPTKAIDNANGYTTDGNAQVIYAADNGNNNQKWKFTKQ